MIIEVKVPAMTGVEIASKISTLQQELEKAKELLKSYQKGKAGKLNVQEILELDEATTAFLDGAK